MFLPQSHLHALNNWGWFVVYIKFIPKTIFNHLQYLALLGPKTINVCSMYGLCTQEVQV